VQLEEGQDFQKRNGSACCGAGEGRYAVDNVLKDVEKEARGEVDEKTGELELQGNRSPR
jgi:hypothetical protein